MSSDKGENNLTKLSALRVARLRAAHQLIDDPPIYQDPLAVELLGEEEKRKVLADTSKFDDLVSRGLRVSLAVRAAFSEQEVGHAIGAGLRQVVVLGAGLDTWAYGGRAAPGLKIFEVDLPSTQHFKRAMLAEASISAPANLAYVEADFESGDFLIPLVSAGFDQEKPVMFTLLGVAMYIDEVAFMALLEVVGGMRGGSGLIFDYCVDDSELSERERKGVDYLSAKLAAQGEPWKSRYTLARMNAMLGGAGFTQVSNFGAPQLNARFLDGRSDALRKSGITRLVRALV